MVFSSFTFLFGFFPLLLIIYFFPPFRKREVRNGILLLFSLAFYSFGGWRLMPVIFLSIVINFTSVEDYRIGSKKTLFVRWQ